MEGKMEEIFIILNIWLGLNVSRCLHILQMGINFKTIILYVFFVYIHPQFCLFSTDSSEDEIPHSTKKVHSIRKTVGGKVFKKTFKGNTRRRKGRCKECAGCLALDCGECMYCR